MNMNMLAGSKLSSVSSSLLRDPSPKKLSTYRSHNQMPMEMVKLTWVNLLLLSTSPLYKLMRIMALLFLLELKVKDIKESSKSYASLMELIDQLGDCLPPCILKFFDLDTKTKIDLCDFTQDSRPLGNLLEVIILTLIQLCITCSI